MSSHKPPISGRLMQVIISKEFKLMPLFCGVLIITKAYSVVKRENTKCCVFLKIQN